MFSNQLVMKAKLRFDDVKHIPSLTQWLQVVGLGSISIKGLCQKISSVEELQDKTEFELKSILTDKGARPEELNRLCRALRILKKYTGINKKTTNLFRCIVNAFLTCRCRKTRR